MKKCEELLDIINIINELNKVTVNFNRAIFEQIDNDTTHMLRKSRKEVEGEINEM